MCFLKLGIFDAKFLMMQEVNDNSPAEGLTAWVGKRELWTKNSFHFQLGQQEVNVSKATNQKNLFCKTWISDIIGKRSWIFWLFRLLPFVVLYFKNSTLSWLIQQKCS